MSNDICLSIREHRYQTKTSHLLNEIKKIVDSYDLPWTVRQIHYNLVERRIVQNIINEYRKVSRVGTDGRYSGDLPWNKIVDDTRGAYKTRDYESIESGIRSFLRNFRLSGRWDNAEGRVEVWVEKRALRRLFSPVTDKYDVYLATGGGWNSTSAIWEAVERIIDYNTNKLDILYFGDLDPSGDDMPRDVEDRLSEFMDIRGEDSKGNNLVFPKEINVHKVLINESDLEKYHLQKRFDVPVKKGNKIVNKIKQDPRALSFYQKYGEIFQVEIEALSPDVLVNILDGELKKYVDTSNFEHVQKTEEKEKKRILDLIAEHETQSFSLDRGE